MDEWVKDMLDVLNGMFKKYCTYYNSEYEPFALKRTDELVDEDGDSAKEI